MTNASYSRFLWKEYRTLRGFWLCVLGFALVTQLFLFCVIEEPDGARYPIFHTAAVLAACYALGCGAVMFASEREDGTYELIRRLPVAPWRTIAGKLSFAVISTLAMQLLLILSAGVLARGGMFAAEIFRRLDILDFVFLLECLAWGLFFSFITGRVLASLLLAVVALMTVSYGTAPTEHLQFNAIRLSALLSVVLLDAWLAHRWMLGRRLDWSWWSRDTRRHSRLATWVAAWETAPPWRRYVKRILWLQWRQARRFFLVYFTVGLVLVVMSDYLFQYLNVTLSELIILATPFLLGLWSFRGEQQGKRFRFLSERGLAPPSIWLSAQFVWFALALLTVVLFVTAAFLGNAFWRNTIGVRPGTWQFLGSMLGFVSNALRQNYDGQASLMIVLASYILMLLLPISSSFALGQAASMLIPRAVTAGFVGAMLLLPLVFWHMLMLSLGVPAWLALLPIPVVLWGVTLVRVSDWMVERNSWGSWARVGAVILLPAAVVLAGIALFRVYQIPADTLDGSIHRPIWREISKYSKGGNPFSVDEFLRPITSEERKTADMYRRAMDLAMGFPTRSFDHPDPQQTKSARWDWQDATPEEQEWFEESQEVLRLTLAASRQEACVMKDPARGRGEMKIIWERRRCATIMEVSANKLEAEGKLERALEQHLAALRMSRPFAALGSFFRWEIQSRPTNLVLNRLVRWAGLPDQNTALISEAMRLVAEEHAKFPPASEAIMTDYVTLRGTSPEPRDVGRRRAAVSDFDAISIHLRQAVPQLIATYCPWERIRGERVFELLTAHAIRDTYVLMDALANGEDLALAHARRRERFVRGHRQAEQRMMRTTMLPETQRWMYDGALALPIIGHETRYQACLLRLALLAYRLEHGKLPERLEELVPKYFEELPRDPWSGRAFGYRAEGFSSVIRFGNLDVHAEEPLIWSVGANNGRVVPIGKTSDGRVQYRVGRMDASGRINSPHTASGIGIAFPLPSETHPFDRDRLIR